MNNSIGKAPTNSAGVQYIAEMDLPIICFNENNVSD